MILIVIMKKTQPVNKFENIQRNNGNLFITANPFRLCSYLTGTFVQNPKRPRNATWNKHKHNQPLKSG